MKAFGISSCPGATWQGFVVVFKWDWGRRSFSFLIGHLLRKNPDPLRSFPLFLATFFLPPRSDLNILGKRVLWEEWRGILGIAAGEMSHGILCPDRVGTHPSETRHTARRRVEPRCSSLLFIPFWNSFSDEMVKLGFAQVPKTLARGCVGGSFTSHFCKPWPQWCVWLAVSSPAAFSCWFRTWMLPATPPLRPWAR